MNYSKENSTQNYTNQNIYSWVKTTGRTHYEYEDFLAEIEFMAEFSIVAVIITGTFFF